MFAVNYTLDEARGSGSTSSPTTTPSRTATSRAISGGTGSSITTLVDLPFGPGQADRRRTRSGLVAGLIGGWQFNTIGEIQSGRPLGLNGSAIQLDPDVALPKSEQSFERWFDNSSTALNNPRPDGTFAWSVLGTNEYRVVKSRFHDVNEPTEPQWSFSFFKNTRVGGEQEPAVPRRDLQRLQHARLRRAEHQPDQRQLRHRRHREPGELPADDSARGADGVLDCRSPVARSIADLGRLRIARLSDRSVVRCSVVRSLGRPVAQVARSFGKTFRSQSFDCDRECLPDDRTTERPSDQASCATVFPL